MKSNNPHMLSLVAENLSIILTFAHSRDSFDTLRKRFEGEWRSVDKLLYEIPELRADRALLELAYILRAIDDAEGISDMIGGGFGTLRMKDSSEADLSLRDMTNKVIHSTRYDWSLADPRNPAVECIGEDSEKWVSAFVLVDALAAACAQLAI